MRIKLPPKIKSNTRQAVIVNQLIDALRSVSPQQTAGALVHMSRRGTAQIPLRKRGGSSSSIVGIQRFRIVTNGVKDDVLLVETWDGTTAGERSHIAKPIELRRTLLHRDEAPAIDDEDFTDPWYSYSDDGNSRTVHYADGTSYREELEPQYVEGDEVVGIKVTGGTGAAVPGISNLEWIDANVGARHFDIPVRVVGFCINGNIYQSFIRASEFF